MANTTQRIVDIQVTVAFPANQVFTDQQIAETLVIKSIEKGVKVLGVVASNEAAK